MPTYEYACNGCGLRFERQQAITEAPLETCPECGGEVRRLVSGGSGFILKNTGHGASGPERGACSLETTGRTCCGRDENCGTSPCGEAER